MLRILFCSSANILSRSLLLLYYVWDSSLSYGAFLGRYPYMRRHLWAAVLIDYFYVIQDVWSWLTLNDVSLLWRM